MQQVNLFAPILQTPSRLFSLRVLVHAWLAIIFVLTAITVNASLNNTKFLSRIEMIEQQAAYWPPKNNLVSMIDIDGLGSEEKTDLLIKKLSHMQEIKRSQIFLLQAIRPHKGFSYYFEDFSKHPVEGLWLSTVNFSSSNESFSIKGYANAAYKVPRWVGDLGKTESFKGKIFSDFLIARSVSSDALYEFSISHGLDDKEHE